jgi:hypothetical protein
MHEVKKTGLTLFASDFDNSTYHLSMIAISSEYSLPAKQFRLKMDKSRNVKYKMFFFIDYKFPYIPLNIGFKAIKREVSFRFH